jgi:hypothetical protein
VSPLRALLARASPARCLDLFVVGNVAFLGVDIAIAHRANAFARREEWLPIALSALATLVLLPGTLVDRLRSPMRAACIATSLALVATGVIGMIFHLESGFFEEQTIANLVYSAPFVAPVAYVGVGLLALLGILEKPETPEWNAWLVFFTLGGFVGNLGLSLLDHAQNGFFSWTEWVPVTAAAFGASFLAVLSISPRRPRFDALCGALLVLEVLVGLVGFGLHLAGDLRRPGGLLAGAVWGAPIFAPMLFADVAVLGLIALWARARSAGDAAALGDAATAS